MKLYPLVLGLLASIFLYTGCGVSRPVNVASFPANANPVRIGEQLSQHFLETGHTNFGGPGRNPGWITYPDVCTWFGALRFAKTTDNKSLIQHLEARYVKLIHTERKLLPNPGHVDNNVFGIVPLQLYQLTGNESYLEMGLDYADKQWTLPAKASDRARQLARSGYSWQTRFWIDDMYMITALQTQAYLATGDKKYIDRAALEMVAYLDSIQRPNGLFYHAPEVPFFWCRGNGWMAAGMTELLLALPAQHKSRKRVLDSYRLMMQTLKHYQSAEGLWRQVIDYDAAWTETSGSAMFLYAMITGLNQGWLDPKEFRPVVKKAWPQLVTYINDNGDISNVCEGTNTKNDLQHYLNRKKNTGDLHGQAPVIWVCNALISS